MSFVEKPEERRIARTWVGMTTWCLEYSVFHANAPQRAPLASAKSLPALPRAIGANDRTLPEGVNRTHRDHPAGVRG